MSDILRYPNDKLRCTSKELYTTEGLMAPGLDLVGERLYKQMIDADGLGLAAIQVGLDIRMFVTSLPFPHKIIINPKWEPTPSGFEYARLEGCLSFPGWLAPVKRFDAIKASYYNVEGKRVELIAKGLAAQVFQHETDHLDGVLLIDHLSEAQKATIEAANAARSE